MGLLRRTTIAVLLVAVVTAASSTIADFSLTSTVMLYLLAVTAASYFLGFSAALFAAFGSFCAINYFFIEPRHTFDVANQESWVVLLGFMVISVVVASLVRRLQTQMLRAELARKRAELARALSEQLAEAKDIESTLRSGCRLIYEAVQLPVGIAMPDMDGNVIALAQQFPVHENITLDQRAVKWCFQNARMMGPGSGNWPELKMWLLPFERLPGIFPVLVVMNTQAVVEEDTLMFLRGLLDQMATAYQRVCNERRAREAENQAQRDAVQNALLASISHDMRTPLTALLGAATALLEQRSALDENEQLRLLISVRAEAQHLANTTENILALSRLELSQERGLRLDWQSPEEIVGAVLQRYQHRPLPHELRSEVPSSTMLIRADAGLLTQALGNLIDNALQVHRGAKPIFVGVTESDAAIALYVSDRGIGFPPDFRLEHIRKFQRFDTHSKGMGLGLVIVQAIAQLHQAQLKISKREGGGTTVAMIFPARQMESESV